MVSFVTSLAAGDSVIERSSRLEDCNRGEICPSSITSHLYEDVTTELRNM